jgi:hypothetical protein
LYAVVLDACVLFPNVLRDTMLTLAESELFQPLWSDRILDEVRRNVIAKRNVDPAALDRTLALMNKPGASCSDGRAGRLMPIYPTVLSQGL